MKTCDCNEKYFFSLKKKTTQHRTILSAEISNGEKFVLLFFFFN